MSKMGAKTYSRKTENKTPFEKFMSEKGNKPSTAKVSVSAVHRWGMTSYTSKRKTHLNGQKDSFAETIEPVSHVEDETKSSHSKSDDSFSFDSGNNSNVKRLRNVSREKSDISRPNKFFKSGSRNKSAISETKASKNDNFDALRLSVHKTWNSAKPADSVTMSQSKKITCSPVAVQSTIDLQNAIFDDSTALKTFDSLTSCIPSSDILLTKSNEICDNFSESISKQTLLIDDYFSKDLLFGQKSCGKKLITENLSCIKTRSNTSTSGNVITPFTRTSTKNENFKASKCDTIDDNSQISPITIHTTYDKHLNTCDSGNMSTVIESYSPNAKQIPSHSNIKETGPLEELKQSTSSIPINLKTGEVTQTKLKTYSRSKKIFSTSVKPKAVYNHRHWQSVKENKESNEEEHIYDEKEQVEKPSSLSPKYEKVEMTSPSCDEFKSDMVTFQSHLPESTQSIKCYRPMKGLYTVVRNVKQAYQCHESGETQEFNDDIEYLLGGLQICNGIRARCLSVLGLASKCMSPAFRIHLRAHGTMPKIFSALNDAASDPTLALCTATLLFVLSQDRLTMDIEASTLSLMLQLLESDPETKSPEKELKLMLEEPGLCALQEKVFQLCEQIQQKGHAKHLKLDNINTGILAMETLLGLTSRKAGEWFKEEIRILHGLDHIVDTISSCVELLMKEESQMVLEASESQMDTVCKIDRCLRVLENVTYLNNENQDYLLTYKNAVVITCCLSLVKLFKDHLMKHPQVTDPTEEETNTHPKNISPVIYCLLSIMKVLLNITYENPSGSSLVGSRENCIDNVLLCVLQVPRSLPREKRFDLLILSLGLMINLVEHNAENRKQIMEFHVTGSFDSINDGYEILASEALIEVMLSRLESAQESEEQADEILSSQAAKQATDSKNTENAVSNAECFEETLMKTLQKAGKHMEHSIIAAYIALILGLIIENSQEHAEALKDLVPDGTFPEMVEVLKKFKSFISLIGVTGGHTGVKSIQRIIEVLNAS